LIFKKTKEQSNSSSPGSQSGHGTECILFGVFKFSHEPSECLEVLQTLVF